MRLKLSHLAMGTALIMHVVTSHAVQAAEDSAQFLDFSSGDGQNDDMSSFGAVDVTPTDASDVQVVDNEGDFTPESRSFGEDAQDEGVDAGGETEGLASEFRSKMSDGTKECKAISGWESCVKNKCKWLYRKMMCADTCNDDSTFCCSTSSDCKDKSNPDRCDNEQDCGNCLSIGCYWQYDRCRAKCTFASNYGCLSRASQCGKMVLALEQNEYGQMRCGKQKNCTECAGVGCTWVSKAKKCRPMCSKIDGKSCTNDRDKCPGESNTAKIQTPTPATTTPAGPKTTTTYSTVTLTPTPTPTPSPPPSPSPPPPPAPAPSPSPSPSFQDVSPPPSPSSAPVPTPAPVPVTPQPAPSPSPVIVNQPPIDQNPQNPQQVVSPPLPAPVPAPAPVNYPVSNPVNSPATNPGTQQQTTNQIAGSPVQQPATNQNAGNKAQLSDAVCAVFKDCNSCAGAGCEFDNLQKICAGVCAIKDEYCIKTAPACATAPSSEVVQPGPSNQNSQKPGIQSNQNVQQPVSQPNQNVQNVQSPVVPSKQNVQSPVVPSNQKVQQPVLQYNVQRPAAQPPVSFPATAPQAANKNVQISNPVTPAAKQPAGVPPPTGSAPVGGVPAPNVVAGGSGTAPVGAASDLQPCNTYKDCKNCFTTGCVWSSKDKTCGDFCPDGQTGCVDPYVTDNLAAPNKC